MGAGLCPGGGVVPLNGRGRRRDLEMQAAAELDWMCVDPLGSRPGQLQTLLGVGQCPGGSNTPVHSKKKKKRRGLNFPLHCDGGGGGGEHKGIRST